jgi:hypothetical protein
MHLTLPPTSRWRHLSLTLLTVLGGLLAALIILEILLRFLGPGRLYRSPDDMLATFDYRMGHGRYKRNRQGTMFIPYGDMVVFDRKTQAAIAESRQVSYHTDSYGFRNDSDYVNEKVLLVGDSFIAGSGSSQENLLSVQLKEDYGIPAYNLGFPGALHSYVRYVQGFLKTHQGEVQVLLFLFEGNDFPISKPKRAASGKKSASPSSSLRIARKEFQQWLKELLVYRYAYSFYHILKKRLKPETYPQVTVIKLKSPDDLSMGFLNSYMAVTRRNSYDGGEEFLPKLARIKDQLTGIFFIPTKFRVYYDILDLQPHPPLPNAQWAYLQEQASRLEISCVDLTGPLQEESQRLLSEGKLTYWKDDSHWNRNGMAVAARMIHAFLQER